MQRAFTMLEIVFIIIILGILAVIALPKLMTTRDDADISVAATNIATFISDINSYYTSQGAISTTIADMTNVSNPVTLRGNSCFTVVAPTATTDEEVVVTIGTTGLCANVWDLPSMINIRTYLQGTFGGKRANSIKVGGISITL